MICENILELIGNTPIVKLNKIIKKYQLLSNIYLKLEGQNIGGSIKSRTAYSMLSDSLKNKIIDQDTVIICPTSGNLGVSLAMICSLLDLMLVIVMPSNTSKHKIKLIKAYGAEIIFSSPLKGMEGALSTINEIKKKYQKHYILDQFSNKSNVFAHKKTAEEIIIDLPNITTLIVASGSGGTITGVSKKLKDYNHQIETILVEPAESPILSIGKKAPHKIEGISPNFIPENLDLEYVDNIECADFQAVLEMQKELAKEEGILVGYSTCASLCVALKYAQYNECKEILVISADYGERYLS